MSGTAFATSRRRFLTLGALGLAGSLAVAGGFVHPVAAETMTFTGFSSKLALDGYDAVAYFTENKPVKGDAAYTHTHDGVEWHFASAANRDAFIADPAKYAPQYGGHCAWATAQNKVAPGDPNVWKIVDGKLYLNYNANVQTRWEKDIPGFITTADANWPGVLKN